MMLRPHWLLPRSPYPSYRAYLDAVGGGAVPGSLSPDVILEQIERSGLRGRGGAGFPAATKWRGMQRHPCPTRYVVCNAAEGEPGTFKDRYLLRYNPYAPIEGILIAAYAIDAKAAFIAIKASFVKEVQALIKALEEMKEVAGDLPSSPNPALASNLETFAHVPSIIRRGGESFRALGTRDTSGTILFTLSGDIARPGVYELEAGISLRRLFEDVGGGPRPGRKLRAAISGVSAGVITEDRFDTPADFGSLAAVGAGLGSAGFVLFDDRASIPRVAQSAARFLYVESCNQCSACKTELRAASEALDAMFDPARSESDGRDLLDRVVLASRRAPQGNRCYLPAEGAALIPSLVQAFRSDFEARIASTEATDREYVIPKIVDFDDATHAFTYDALQPYKQPNWTYDVPPGVATRPVISGTVLPSRTS
jgi:NADH-quinone oxidoreductase subunit F